MTNFIDLEAIAQQGPIFWAACLAVAAGVAMIAAATVVQTRRLGRRISERADPEPAKQSTPAAADPEPARKTVQRVPHIAADQVAMDHTDNDQAAQRLEGLLGRLERVAGRLDLADTLGPAAEEAESAQSQRTQTPGESDLKDEGQGVEYVFRAAGG